MSGRLFFHRQQDLQAIYSNLTTTAIHAVKPDNIATFLGRKLATSRQSEIGNRYNVRIEGTRIKHTMGPVSIKMYDKYGQILRIETTVNDVCFFTHYRRVEHRDGTSEKKIAVMKRTIHSLPALRERVLAANLRYLEFISAIEDRQAGIEKLHKLSRPASVEGRRYAGFNFFDERDESLLHVLARGEFNISGFKNKHIRFHLQNRSSSSVSRLLKRLRLHGLIKRVGGTYKYYLTCFGKQVITTALKLRELFIIPQLAFNPSR
ncbi:MAG: MarR family transcriptional regulator [Acidobacteriota bacterium]